MLRLGQQLKIKYNSSYKQVEKEKSWDHSFMIKNSQQTKNQTQLSQGHLLKPTNNIIVNSKKLNNFPDNQEQGK